MTLKLQGLQMTVWSSIGDNFTGVSFFYYIYIYVCVCVCVCVYIDNSTFERVKDFKYLGTILTNQNSIVEEITSRLRSGNACYRSVQNLLSSRLLSKNLKIKTY